MTKSKRKRKKKLSLFLKRRRTRSPSLPRRNGKASQQTNACGATHTSIIPRSPIAAEVEMSIKSNEDYVVVEQVLPVERNESSVQPNSFSSNSDCLQNVQMVEWNTMNVRKHSSIAFHEMKYHAKSLLPRESVLRRRPDSEQNRDCCPRPLWILMEKFGGFVPKWERGKAGFSRSQMCYQLVEWKKHLCGSEENKIIVPPMYEETYLEKLLKLTPETDELIRITNSHFKNNCSLCVARPHLVHVDISCFTNFWENQQHKMCKIFATAVYKHITDKIYIEKNCKIANSYETLENLIKAKYEELENNCTCVFCEINGACDCIQVLSNHFFDMFFNNFMTSVSRVQIQGFLVPPPSFKLSQSYCDSVYNIAGFLLRKLQNLEADVSCKNANFTAFLITHRISLEDAKKAQLPYEKVLQRAYNHNPRNLIFASKPFFEFVRQIEILCLINVQNNQLYQRRENCIKNLHTFIVSNKIVCQRWKNCINEVILAYKDAIQDINKTVEEFSALFKTFASTYVHVRGKEISVGLTNQMKSKGEILPTRRACVRDSLAQLSIKKQ